MLLRAVLVLVLIALAGYGAWEMRCWSTPEGHDLISAKQRRLRLWGLFFLLADFGLCLGWTYLPKPHTRRELIGYTQYIMLICVTALPLVPLAMLDWRENLRHLAASRKKLVQETLISLPHENADPPA
jgi:hypothetical protein